MFNKKIFILDDVLTPNECFDLIEFYKKLGPSHKWQSFFPRTLTPQDHLPSIFVKRILNEVETILDLRFDIVKCEIVYWPLHSEMMPHKDYSSNETVFTSITYLNDNYEGGRTYFVGDMEFQPKVGRTVCFDGKEYLHGVSQITRNERYSLPIWYKLLN